MRVQVLPADQGGCSFYRCKLPVLAILQQDHEVDCFINDEVRAIRDARDPDEIVDAVPFDRDVDVVVLQRPTMRDVVRCIPFLQKRGIAVVVEIDDDLVSVPHHNSAWHKLQPHLNEDSNHLWLTRACRMADLVTCTTPALARRYAPHGRERIIGNYIDDNWINVSPSITSERRWESPTIGWTGHPMMHPYDLRELGTALRTVIDDTGARFYHIGGGIGEVFETLGIDGDVGDGVEWLPLDEYPVTMANEIDIGVVPLDDSNFNQAKSWLKGLEYAALGIPFVASPTDNYMLLHQRMRALGLEEPFYLAKSSWQWISRLKRLVNNKDLRMEMGDNLKRMVADNFLISHHTHEFIEAWRKARATRRNQVPRLHPQGWPSASLLNNKDFKEYLSGNGKGFFNEAWV